MSSRSPSAFFDFAVVVTDPRQADNPIVFASQAFLRLTGYDAEEVIGQNCRFLQGPETERRHIAEVRNAIREERPCQVCLLNYRKNGDKFWNQLYLEPIVDDAGRVTRYVGVQADVTHLMRMTGPAMLQVVPMEDVKRIVETERRNADVVVRRLSEDGAISVTAKDTCSILPSSILLSLDRIQQSFVLVDPNLPDMPIVHASDAFVALTGYPKDQLLGRNCRFLQGPLTDAAEVAKIHKAVRSDPPQTVTTTLLNYKHDGTPFWNALHISPLRNADGHVAYLIGVQLNVNDQESCVALDGLSLPNVSGTISRHGRHIPYCGKLGLKQQLLQNGTVGEVRMAIRSLSGSERGLRRSFCKQTDDLRFRIQE